MSPSGADGGRPGARSSKSGATRPKARADQASATKPKARADQASATRPKARADQASATKPKARGDQASATRPKARADQASATRPKARGDQASATRPKASATKPKSRANTPGSAGRSKPATWRRAPQEAGANSPPAPTSAGWREPESRHFSVGDKASTARIYRAPPALAAAVGRTLVLAHGAGADQSHRFMTGFAAALAARGIDVVTFDFFYSAAGRGAPDRNDALEACWRAALALGREAFDGRVPFIGGKSMGGRIASHLAAAGDDVRGLVLLGYPLHPPKQPEKLRTAHLPRLALPTLIVQGKRDPFGTPDELRAHFPPATELAELPGAHSYDEKAWPDAHRLVAEFVRR